MPNQGLRPIWITAAAFAAAGLVVGVVKLESRAAAEPPAIVLAEASGAGSGSAASPEIPAAAPPVAAFRQRLALFAPLEALLRRASAPLRRIAQRPHGSRVEPGASDEACLAQAVYYEARGEPAAGQAAVAQVVLNRTRSGAHPASVCDVVFQGAARPGCQFSFACDPRLGGRRPEAAAWGRAQAVAATALQGGEVEGLRTALNYHADYVRPGWAARLQRTAEIGRHIFYSAAAPPLDARGAPGE